MAKRYGFPQPFDELDHTADAGVVVRGDSEGELLARLVLAMSHMLAGGGPLEACEERTIAVEPGDRTSMAIDVLRELLFVFERDRLVAASCRVDRFDPERGASVALEMARYDPDVHAEGIELKAVTWHEAQFERDDAGWRAQVVFDV